MSKKLTFGKLLGIILCILAAAGTVVLLCLNIYFGGQMKLIDKYFTAIERDDFESYRTCLEGGKDIPDLEEQFSVERDSYMLLQDNENFRINPKFSGRQKIDGNIYLLTLDMTIYNDSESYYDGVLLIPVCRENGKWVLTSLW